MSILAVVLSASLSTVVDQTPPQYAFPAREHRQKGAGAYVAVAAGDLDGDGFDDLVSTTSNAWVKVWRGRALGGLESAGLLVTPDVVHALALGDVDADGDLDLAFAAGSKLYVAAGDGSAHFAAPNQIGMLNGVVKVALADVDSDGRSDVCAISQVNGKLRAWLAQAGGGFHAPVTSAVSEGPGDFELADLDGDGALDLAVADSAANAVVIARGAGDGSFAVLDAYNVTQASPTAIALGDMNGDGHVDFATASKYFPVLQQRMGLGDGSFGPLATCGNGQDIELVDWDGDGTLDRLALLGGAALLPGTGACGFEVPHRLPVSETATALAILDANGDGLPDLAYGAASDVDESSGLGDDFTSVGLVAGDGRLGALDVVALRRDASIPPTPLGPVGDLDLDGIVDLAGVLPDKSGVAIRRGTGKASLHDAQVVPFGGTLKSALPADLDGDGDLDLVGLAENGVHTALSTGTSFLPSTQVLAILSVTYLQSGDLNGDGWDDLCFLTPSGVVSFLSRGNGAFAGPMLSPDVEFPSLAPLLFQMVDLDGDLHLDLVVVGWYQGIWTYSGVGDGRFVPAGYLHSKPWWMHVTAGDLNGDGLDDIVVANSNVNCGCDLSTVETLISDGGGGFQLQGEYEVGRWIGSLDLHDLNGDGVLDLYAWLQQGVLATAYGDGAGGFSPAKRHGATGIPLGAGHADPGGLVDFLVAPLVAPTPELEDLQFVLQR